MTTCDLARCSPNQPANHREALLPADRERLLPGLGQANEALIVAAGAVWIWNLAGERFPGARQRPRDFGVALRFVTGKFPRMQKPPKTFFTTAEFVPELREIFEMPPLDPKKIILAAIPIKDPHEHKGVIPAGADRCQISLTDGNEFWFWEPDSLRALFRGDQQPPELGDYPEAYNDSFILFDLHVLEISKFFGDRRDAKMREIYAALRKRPDGPSRGFVHDYLWQAAALVLGTRPLSQAEFEAIMGRLERSCRTFELGPSSRNYVAALRSTFGREE